MNALLAGLALALAPEPKPYVAFKRMAVPVVSAEVQGKPVFQYKPGQKVTTIEVETLPFSTQIPRLCEYHHSGDLGPGRLVARGSAGLMALDYAKCRITQISFPALETDSNKPLKLGLTLSVEGVKPGNNAEAIRKSLAREGRPGVASVELTVKGKVCPFKIKVAPFTLDGKSDMNLKISGGDWNAYFQGLVYTDRTFRAASANLVVNSNLELKLNNVRIKVQGKTASFAARSVSIE